MTSQTSPDPRHLSNGLRIPTLHYADQPYVVQTDDDHWLCTLTTGLGEEGAAGQHVTTLRSPDRGRTWSDPVPVEPGESRENSYAVMLKVSSGRIYIFYNFNTQDMREVLTHGGRSTSTRVDTLGEYVLKYSDDHGQTWSKEHTPIPVREFACDRDNVYDGNVRFFWNVGRPFLHDGAAYVPLHKVGRLGEGFLEASEGVLLRCGNLLTEDAPEKLEWETLPDGEVGLRTPPGGGPVSEEQSACALSDGSLYCIYRCTAGYPVECYSRDGGHTWTPPRYVRYADGSLMKHPRAACFAWKASNGKYLCWYHNHGGPFIPRLMGQPSGTNGLVEGGRSPYDDRNPVWLSGGAEIDTPDGREIAWSQPEIVLYDDDPLIRISYPDLIEQEGHFYLTETQKAVARVHEIDPSVLSALWNKPSASDPETAWQRKSEGTPEKFPLPAFPAFVQRDGSQMDYRGKDLRSGFTIEAEVILPDLEAGHRLLDNRTPWGQGFALETRDKGVLEIILQDGRSENRWTSDPGMLSANTPHRVAVIVDGGPKLILFVTDGKLHDGGDHRQFGWGRFSPTLQSINGEDQLRIHPAVQSLKIYHRALRVNETGE